jgi:hypothetical protein
MDPKQPNPEISGSPNRMRPSRSLHAPTLTLEALARRAADGDRDAVSAVARALQGDAYGLALRMLWQREDAEDATAGPADDERAVLTEKVKIGCTLGPLQCSIAHTAWPM